MKKFFLSIALSIFFVQGMKAQHIKEERLESSFQFIYENDYFSATDYYFTQGVRWELTLPGFRKLPTRYALLHLKNASADQFSISPNQDCYTPTSIRHDDLLVGDHPYAGALYLGFSRISSDSANQRRLTSEIDIGGVGPCASCAETQYNIHKWTNNYLPKGWKYQVRNDIALDYQVKYEKGVFDNRTLDLIAFADARAGTLYDYAGLGLKMRFGWKENYFGLPKYSKHLKLYLHYANEVRAVGYNAALEGGMFNKSTVYTIASEDMERSLVRVSFGVVLIYKKLNLEYTKTYQSPEFKNGLYHGWGHCVIAVYF